MLSLGEIPLSIVTLLKTWECKLKSLEPTSNVYLQHLSWNPRTPPVRRKTHFRQSPYALRSQSIKKKGKTERKNNSPLECLHSHTWKCVRTHTHRHTQIPALPWPPPVDQKRKIKISIFEATFSMSLLLLFCLKPE